MTVFNRIGGSHLSGTGENCLAHWQARQSRMCHLQTEALRL